MSIQKLLFADIETVEDTDVFVGPPSDGAKIIDTIGLSIERYAGNKVSRDVDRNLVGQQEQVNAAPQAIMSCGVYATGFGVAGTAGLYDVLIRAAGFARTDDATPGSEKNTYNMVDSGHESVSLYDYMDDIDMYQLITGARGSMAFSMGVGELAKFDFSNFIGSYNSPAAGNRPTFAASAWDVWANRPVLVMSKANTPTVTLDGFAIKPSQFNIDWARTLNRLDLPNFKSTLITNRLPTGSFTILAPAMGVKDFYAKQESHSGVAQKIAVSLIQGTVAGDIIEISASEFQIDNITDTEIEGEQAFTVEGRFIDSPAVIVR